MATLSIPCFEQQENNAWLKDLTVQERATARALAEEGYVIIEFPEPELKDLADQIRRDLAPQLCGPGADALHAGRPVRVQDHPHPAVRRIAANERIRQLLSKLYGREAFPFQTLTFSVGTQQPVHSDDVHFSSVPKGFMCGVWLALEDVHPEAGPLAFYPQSHFFDNADGVALGQHPFHNPDRQPREFSGDIDQVSVQPLWNTRLESADTAQKRFLAKRGQALIWVYNLLHGGAPRTDLQRTRWSQVTHYYFQDCEYYTPLLSQYANGDIRYREDVEDLRTGTLMSQPPQAVLPNGFDERTYLDLHADVRAAGADAKEHWLRHGFFERRRYK